MNCEKQLRFRIRDAIQDPEQKGVGYRYYYYVICDERLDDGEGESMEPLQRPRYVPSKINQLYFGERFEHGLLRTIQMVNSRLAAHQAQQNADQTRKFNENVLREAGGADR